MTKLLILVLLLLPTSVFAAAVGNAIGERIYYLYDYAGSNHAVARPLVIALHPGLSHATQFESETSIDTAADAGQFYVVYLEGVGYNPDLYHTFNAQLQKCCGDASNAIAPDDEDFIKRVVYKVIQDGVAIDTSKIFFATFSNGSMMAYTMLCKYPDRYAGAFLLAGALLIDEPECVTGHFKSVMHIHGSNDTVIPPQGGYSAWAGGVVFRPLAETVNIMQQHRTTYITGSPVLLPVPGCPTTPLYTVGHCLTGFNAALNTRKAGDTIWKEVRDMVGSTGEWTP